MGSGDKEGVVELLAVQGLDDVVGGKDEEEGEEEENAYGEGG